mmetsp:Transcript_157963/g.506651  ORF Transcript_157963/g.506651 Transcript_157963/m.506651 type:complete len:327 (-) Transcript_157963:223-1203(-)
MRAPYVHTSPGASAVISSAAGASVYHRNQVLYTSNKNMFWQRLWVEELENASGDHWSESPRSLLPTNGKLQVCQEGVRQRGGICRAASPGRGRRGSSGGPQRIHNGLHQRARAAVPAGNALGDLLGDTSELHQLGDPGQPEPVLRVPWQRLAAHARDLEAGGQPPLAALRDGEGTLHDVARGVLHTAHLHRADAMAHQARRQHQGLLLPLRYAGSSLADQHQEQARLRAEGPRGRPQPRRQRTQSLGRSPRGADVLERQQQREACRHGAAGAAAAGSFIGRRRARHAPPRAGSDQGTVGRVGEVALQVGPASAPAAIRNAITATAP